MIVPAAPPDATTPNAITLDDVAAALRGRRVLVVGGAGVSTESGIPDYRGPESRKTPRNPMRFQQFVGSEAARRRYWARSLIGWRRIAEAAPNAAHRALAQLETISSPAGGGLTGLITQNVDGLHQAAGSRRVLELHGSLAAVRCLGCGAVSSRRLLQRQLAALNPDAAVRPLEIAPDGDAELEAEVERAFMVPPCASCGGVLKPDVVFFGENVPKARVLRAYALLAQAELLLVVGSSLTVFSGYRFVVQAVKEGKPVVILNQGETRGDADAALKLSGRLGQLLPALAERLARSPSAPACDMLDQTPREAVMTRRVYRFAVLALLWSFMADSAAFGQDIETGDRLFAEGDYATAAAAYQKSFETDGDGVALYKLANAKVYEAGLTEGDAAETLYDEAVTAAKEAVRLVPDDLEAHMALVRAWGRLAQYRGVLESLNLATLMKEEMDLILERDPDHDGALHALALWHLNVPWIFGGRPEKTRGLFERAIAIEPTVLHHLEYGEALIKLDDPTARAQLEAALALPAETAADRHEQARAQALLDDSF